MKEVAQVIIPLTNIKTSDESIIKKLIENNIIHVSKK